MKSAAITLLLCLASMVAVAATSDKQASSVIAAKPFCKLIFKNNGFAILPLDELDKSGSNKVLQMFLQSTDHFAPNISVTTQQYTGSAAGYLAMTIKQCEEMKWKVLSSKATTDTMVLEYVGTAQDLNLHFYQQAVFTSSTVYLANATALEDQWEGTASLLKSCVGQLKANQGAAAIAPDKSGNKLVFKNNGFSIPVLEEPGKVVEGRVLAMFLPPSDGFSPNVGVNTGPFTGTIAEYAAEYKKELEASGFKVESESQKDDGLTVEFSGVARGRSVHGCQKVVFKDGIIYRGIAMANENQWKVSGAKLKACVDSLEVLSTGKSAAPAAKSASSAKAAN